MLTMHHLVEFQFQQHFANEMYRRQILQRIPDPFSSMLPLPMTHHVHIPPRPTLTGVEAKLENRDLWQQFHKIGTEMIITKCGRRMFPSMRVSISGLEDEANYIVLLEMIPIGECRYKFSGSQWIPAGGAEPQTHRMYVHPDSPNTGAHWKSQAILFNKVKLTNSSMDNGGHIVLSSMHKYQPRLHIIRATEISDLAWSPQQAFIFPETEFVAVTAYQNDRITKLKIDNNPFAKGFRESGQSRCKRKLSPLNQDQDHEQSDSTKQSNDDDSEVASTSSHIKRVRSDGFSDDDRSFSSGCSSGPLSPEYDEPPTMVSSSFYNHPHAQLQNFMRHPMALNYTSAAAAAAASGYFLIAAPSQSQTHQPSTHPMHQTLNTASHHLSLGQHQHPMIHQQPSQLIIPPPQAYVVEINSPPAVIINNTDESQSDDERDLEIEVETDTTPSEPPPTPDSASTPPSSNSAKRSNFSISAILAF